MNRLLYSVVLLTAFCQLALQVSMPDDPYYIAGVVEFNEAPAGPMSLDDNVASYLEIIASPGAFTTDIIIFPEQTLNGYDETTYVPDAADEAVPCDDTDGTLYHPFLVKISCEAKQQKKYVVVNVIEKETCPSRPEDQRPCALTGLNIYNTNVVFNRDGAVISRYRKVNLFGEPKNTTYTPEYGMFDTDFGVRFGHFICFDLLFYTPAQELVEKYGIKDFIFPTMWFSQLPFLTAVQIQHAWAYANDVNFLAAGSSDPSVGSTGTGIYAGRQGPLMAVMNHGQGERAIYVTKVPKRNMLHRYNATQLTALSSPSSAQVIRPVATIDSGTHLTQDDIFLLRDKVENYSSFILDLNERENFSINLCYDKNFCCHFNLAWTRLNATPNSRYYSYRLGVYDGWRSEDVANSTNKLKNCALFSCISNDIMDCGKLLPVGEQIIEPQAIFTHIEIEATFPDATEVLLMPNSLKEDLMPLPVDAFEWHATKTGSSYNVRYVMTSPTDDLLTFSIYGNYYQGQIIDDGDGGAASVHSMSALLLAAIVVVIHKYL